MTNSPLQRGNQRRPDVLPSVGLDELREPGELVGVGRREHAVAEVEDVARGARAPASSTSRGPVRASPRSGRRRGSGRGCPAPRGRPDPRRPPRRAAPASRRRRRRRRPRPSGRAARRCRPRSGCAGTPSSPTAASTARGVRHARAAGSRPRVSAPAHESKSWTADAPASTCTRRNAAAMPAILRISASQTLRVRRTSAPWSGRGPCDGPPSTRYDATVNGAPAKPISGVAPSSADELPGPPR